MRNIALFPNGVRPKKILAVGAHADDIEIGCGGTILRLLHEQPDVEVVWVVLAATGKRATEAKESADEFLCNAQSREVVIGEFRDGYFPYMGAKIKEFFEGVARKFCPDLVLTHCRHDLHQDHRLASELTWNTFRNQLILEYEIAKYDGDLGSPNFFVQLNDGIARRKVESILGRFVSQRDKDWFTEDLFYALLRLRGIECRSTSGFAEAFYARKVAV